MIDLMFLQPFKNTEVQNLKWPLLLTKLIALIDHCYRLSRKAGLFLLRKKIFFIY